MSGEQFAAMLESRLPRTSIPQFGGFYFNNGSWWQDAATLTAPNQKRIRVLFESVDPHQHALPTSTQIGLLRQIEQRLPGLWPQIERSFQDYLREMTDSGQFENSQEWEISVGEDPSDGEHEWTISFKLPGGDASWYQRVYRNFEADVTHGTY